MFCAAQVIKVSVAKDEKEYWSIKCRVFSINPNNLDITTLAAPMVIAEVGQPAGKGIMDDDKNGHMFKFITKYVDGQKLLITGMFEYKSKDLEFKQLVGVLIHVDGKSNTIAVQNKDRSFVKDKDGGLLYLFIEASKEESEDTASIKQRRTWNSDNYPPEIENKLNRPLRNAIDELDVAKVKNFVDTGENLNFSYDKAFPASPDTLTPLQYAEVLLEGDTWDKEEDIEKANSIIKMLKKAIEK